MRSAFFPPPPRVIALATAVLFSACADETPTGTAPQGPASNVVAGIELPIPIDSIFEDEPMMAVALKLPATFGGFWYNDRDEIVVGLTDPKDLSAAVALIRPWIGAHQPKGYVAQIVQYPFLRLAAYRTLLRRQVFEIPGVVAIGVNEMENRVKVAVTDESARTAVRQLMSLRAVPEEMVILPTMPRATKTTLLTNAQPQGDIQGGWQITYKQDQFGDHACTLGFPALDVDQSYNEVFVTNSHCTAQEHQYDGGAIHQPSWASTTFGHEIRDPSPHTCGLITPDECRHADAALIEADVDMQFGTIARTTSRSGCESCPTTNTLDTNNPTIAITGRQDNVFQNETLDKMGIATGWTYGGVEDTCDDTDGGGDWTVQCADRVDYQSADGDSGGPVFYFKTDSTAELRGITWGRIFSPYFDSWMSDLNQIENDLGPLIVYAPPVLATITGPDLVPPSSWCQWNGTAQGRPPYTYEWRRDGVVVSTTSSYTTSDTGTTDFQLSFKVTDARLLTNTDFLNVVIGGPPGGC